MSTPLISIIVPIYKVEPYLRRCLDSIVNQSYTNLEIILVDDGSPDNCPQLCEEYATKDNRIVVIHKQNGGLSEARNTGLNICKGDYISFIDSDDWVNHKYIEIMLAFAKQYDADIVVSNYELVYEDGRTKKNFFTTSPIEILNSHQAVKKLFIANEVVYVIACAKLFKKNIFNKIRFPKGKIHEDEYVAHEFLYQSKKTVVLNQILYYYLQRAGSITANSEKNSLRVLEARIQRYNFFYSKNEYEILNLCLGSLCWDLLFAYYQLSQKKKVFGFTSKEEALVQYRKCAQDYYSKGKISFSKIIHFFFSHCPQAYILYQKTSPFIIRKH